MRSALGDLASIPIGDVRALQKMWGGELPPPRPLGARPALLVVDMTEAFVRDEFPTGWSATGVPCVEALVRLRTAARAVGAPVLYTVTAPMYHSAQVGDWLRGRPGPSMFPFDQEGRPHDIVDDLAPGKDEIVMAKPKPSTFFGTQLESMLNALAVDTLIVTGMTTSGCVRATVNDGFMLNRHVVVPAECVADRSQLSHEVELFDMGAKYADVVTLDSLVNELSAQTLPNEWEQDVADHPVV